MGGGKAVPMSLLDAIKREREDPGGNPTLCVHAKPCRGCGRKITCGHPAGKGEERSVRNCSSDMFCTFYEGRQPYSTLRATKGGQAADSGQIETQNSKITNAPRGHILFLTRKHRHEGPAKEIVECLTAAGYGVTLEYINTRAKCWNVPKHVAARRTAGQEKPIAVLWWEEGGWLFVGTNKEGQAACKWCWENDIVPLQVDFGYFNHYHSVVFDAYDADGVCSIARHWQELPEVPQWSEAPEVVSSYVERMGRAWERAGRMGPVDGAEPGYILLYLQGSSFSSVLPGVHENDYDGWVAQADKELRDLGERPVWKYANIHKRTMPAAHVGFGSRLRDADGNRLPNIPELNTRLLRYAKHSVVITSSVSNEAVLRGLPVVACGKGWHRGRGVFTDANEWKDLAVTPTVDHVARGKWINWWLRKQVPLKDCAEGLTRAVWEARHPSQTLYGVGRGLGNLLMAVPAMKALAVRSGGAVESASGKLAALGYREWLADQRFIRGGVPRRWPPSDDYDTVAGVAWDYYVPPAPKDGRRLGPGPKGRGPHETIADASPYRQIGGNDLLPSGRMAVHANVPTALPIHYVVVAMDCTDKGGTLAPWNKRRWPHWEKFCRLWKGRTPLVFLGTDRTEWAERYGRDLMGKTTVEGAAAIIEQADALVGIDGGLSHAAGAVRTPAVILYGPTTSYREGAWYGGLTPVASGRRCRACFMDLNWDTCRDARCMADIEPERVVDVLERVLRRAGRPLERELAFEQCQARLGYAARREIKPAQAREEMMMLWPLVRELHPRRIVEIGSKRGGWTYGMAPTFAPHAQIVMLDIHPKVPNNAKAVEELQAEEYQAELLVADSDDPQTLELLRDSVLNGAPVDLLHLDANHDTADTLRTWASYSPLVRSGGLVVLHDLYNRREGVMDAFLEILDGADQFRVAEWQTAVVKRQRGNQLGIAIARMA